MINYIDIILLSIVAFFAIKGLFKGLIAELLGLAGLFGGLILATKYMNNAASWLDQFIDVPPALASLIGYMVIFIGVQLAVQVGIFTLDRLTNVPLVGMVFQVMGGVVGTAKGAIIASMLVLLVSILPIGESLIPGIRESRLWPHAKTFAPKIYNLVSKYVTGSKSFHAELKESLESLPTKQMDQHAEDFLESLAEDVSVPEELELPKSLQGK